MAHPFRVFRRYQKAFLIFFGVILILVFVLEDTLKMFVGGSSAAGARTGERPAANAKAVHWKGGSFTNAEMEQLITRRRILNRVIYEIYANGQNDEQIQALKSGATMRQPSVVPLQLPQTPQQGVEQDIVRTRLLSEAAKAAGMTVSDEMLKQYLDELGLNHVTREHMRQIIGNIQLNRGGTPTDYIFEALREELLAYYLVASQGFSRLTFMPQQLWQDWLRANDRVVVEAAPFPATAFVVDVKEPTAEELQAYYDKYKDRESYPEFFVGGVELPSSLPAFKIPRKIALQYIRVDYDKLLAKAKAELTDDEVTEYYEKNKEPYYRKLDTTLFDKPTEKSDDATKEGDAKKDDAGKKDDTAKTDDATKPAGKEADARATKSDAKSPAAAPDAKSSKSADATRGPQIRLAAFEQAAGKTQAPPASSGTSQPAGAAPAATQPAADAAKSATGDEKQPAGDQKATAGDQKTAAGEKPGEEPKKEYQPLDDKLRDEIRGTMARPKVAKELDKIATDLQANLNSQFNKYFTAKIDAEATKQPVPPPPAVLTDMSSLADEAKGLEFRKTDELTYMDFREDKTIGKLIDIDHSTPSQPMPLINILFSKLSDVFKPIVTMDIDNNRYVLLKTSDTPARVPPLDEIRNQVIQAWRLEKASEIALKRAQEVAKKAQDNKTTLGDLLADDPNVKVIRTDPFSWITRGDVALVSQQIPYHMSAPSGIVAAGPEFLRTVFNLGDGETGATLNHDHSIAYAIRVAEHTMPEDKLRDTYLAEATSWPGINESMTTHMREYQTNYMATMLQSAGVTWDRPPDEVKEEE